jgi:CBS-domain-containing membrane protein
MEHTVEAVMTSQVVTARPASPSHELMRLLEQHHVSALPVVDDSGRLVGIVSEDDLLIKEGYPHGAADASPADVARYRKRLDKAAGTRAAEVMAAPVSSVPLGTLVADTVRLMLRLDVKRLPVVDARGRLAGIVTRSDLLKVFLRPDPAVRWEVDHDIIRGEFGIADGAVRVEVRDGVVSLRGQVGRRGQVAALVRRVQAVDGVAQVDAQLLSWRIDDQVTTAARPVT